MASSYTSIICYFLLSVAHMAMGYLHWHGFEAIRSVPGAVFHTAKQNKEAVIYWIMGALYFFLGISAAAA